jgi:hypothetical protein
MLNGIDPMVLVILYTSLGTLVGTIMSRYH